MQGLTPSPRRKADASRHNRIYITCIELVEQIEAAPFELKVTASACRQDIRSREITHKKTVKTTDLSPTELRNQENVGFSYDVRRTRRDRNADRDCLARVAIDRSTASSINACHKGNSGESCDTSVKGELIGKLVKAKDTMPSVGVTKIYQKQQ